MTPSKIKPKYKNTQKNFETIELCHMFIKALPENNVSCKIINQVSLKKKWSKDAWGHMMVPKQG